MTGKWDETIFAASDVNAYQDANNILAFSDSKGTKGNFVQDVDGNVLLDLCGTESLPLGHNNDALIKVSALKHLITLFMIACQFTQVGSFRC